MFLWLGIGAQVNIRILDSDDLISCSTEHQSFGAEAGDLYRQLPISLTCAPKHGRMAKIPATEAGSVLLRSFLSTFSPFSAMI